VREAYRDINSFFNQIRDPIEQQQSRTHRRIGVQEGVEHRSHVKLSKPEGRRDRQQSTRLLLLSRGASLCDVERREYLPTSCKVGPPELRQTKRPRGSMHERHRETALEQRDLLAVTGFGGDVLRHPALPAPAPVPGRRAIAGPSTPTTPAASAVTAAATPDRPSRSRRAGKRGTSDRAP